jgi:hypothetical protein
MRREVETKIASALIDDGIAAGYTISVYDGEETVLTHSTDKEAILSAMFSTDEDILIFAKHNKRVGYVNFVYGNSGWDVIADYSVKLEHLMANADRISDEYSN